MGGRCAAAGCLACCGRCAAAACLACCGRCAAAGCLACCGRCVFLGQPSLVAATAAVFRECFQLEFCLLVYCTWVGIPLQYTDACKVAPLTASRCCVFAVPLRLFRVNILLAAVSMAPAAMIHISGSQTAGRGSAAPTAEIGSREQLQLLWLLLIGPILSAIKLQHVNALLTADMFDTVRSTKLLHFRL